MKKIIFILFISLISFGGNAQSVFITSKCIKSIDTPGNITFNPGIAGILTLDNVELKCNTLTFDASLTTIIIRGDVNIKCNNIIINTPPNTNIIINGTKGQLTFEYPSGNFSNARGFEPQINSQIKLIFKPF